MKKLIIVGNCYQNQSNGAANIIRGLVREFEKLNINFEKILVSENFSKKQTLKKLYTVFLKQKNCVINIHTDGLKLPLIVYIMSLFDKKNKYYLTVHGSYLIESSFGRSQNKINLFIEKIIYKNFANMICVSEMQKKDLIKLYKRKKPVIVIPNATNAMDYSIEKKPLNENKRFLMLGGIRTEKGIWKTLEFIRYIREKSNLLVELDIYGNIEKDISQDDFREKLKSMNLENYVHYRGCVTDKKDVYSIIASSDFQICFSNYDSFNVAIIESLVLGCPCLCTNKCGASYFVEKYGGGLVVNLSDESWMENAATYIVGLCQQPLEYKKECTKAKNIQNDVTWENVCKMYISHMELR